MDQAKVEELISIYDEYLAFIAEGLVLIACSRGWTCSEEAVQKGKKFRKQIAALKEEVLAEGS